jgi:IS5 family transposase
MALPGGRILNSGRVTHERSKNFFWQQRFRKSKNGAKQARKADQKVKTIAGRLVRELERKLSAGMLGVYANKLSLFKRVLSQKRADKNKIYSLHEPHVSCISKGKAHKPYEFDNKVSVLLTQRTCVIVGAESFQGNPYDGHTLEQALMQYERLNNRQPASATVDRGYRGPKQIGQTAINIADAPNKSTKTRTQRSRLRRRSAIEPIIGHLKADHRMGCNFLSGIKGDAINVLLAAAAFNFKRAMRKVLGKIHFILAQLWKLFQLPKKSLLAA